jgi:hypothetical protein
MQEDQFHRAGRRLQHDDSAGGGRACSGAPRVCAKIIVGIGAFWIVTGPFVGYNTVVGVNKTSSMPGALPCKSGTLNTSMRFGVGYQIPQVVTDAINFFMHALGIKPINSEGGFEQEEPLINKTDYVPEGCKPRGTP